MQECNTMRSSSASKGTSSLRAAFRSLPTEVTRHLLTSDANRDCSRRKPRTAAFSLHVVAVGGEGRRKDERRKKERKREKKKEDITTTGEDRRRRRRRGQHTEEREKEGRKQRKRDERTESEGRRSEGRKSEEAVEGGEEIGESFGGGGGEFDEAGEVEEGEQDREVADGAGGDGEEEEAEGEDGEAGAEVEGSVVPAVVEEGELDGEEDGQDGLHEPRHDAGVAEVLEAPAVFRGRRDLGRGVEASDDDIGREAREALDRRRPDEAAVAVPEKSVGHVGAAGNRVEFFR
mmetsp:Transcript_20808/g.64301  ORF Transcript_20808/g.64301 Transcript_20808/m.64301 type:complete len:290 (-) Transcript_20808:1103-1972(-)